MAKKSHFLSGAIIGAALGAAATFLTTTKKGEEMRLDALDRFNDFRDDPQAAFDDLKSASLDRFNETKAKFESGEYSADKAKDYLLSKKDEIREMVESGDLSLDSVKEFISKATGSVKEGAENVADEAEDAVNEALDSDFSWTKEDEEVDDDEGFNF